MLSSAGLPGFNDMAFLTFDGLPAFRSGTTTGGLTWDGSPMFGLPEYGEGTTVSTTLAAIVLSLFTPTIETPTGATVDVPLSLVYLVTFRPRITNGQSGGSGYNKVIVRSRRFNRGR